MVFKNRKSLVNGDERIAVTCFTSVLEGDISPKLSSHLEGLTAVQLPGPNYPSEVPCPLTADRQEGLTWLGELKA